MVGVFILNNLEAFLKILSSCHNSMRNNLLPNLLSHSSWLGLLYNIPSLFFSYYFINFIKLLFNLSLSESVKVFV